MGRAGMSAARQVRWWVVLVFFLASVNNYLDRQALSVLAPVLRADLGLTAFDYSLVINSFLLAYAVMYAGSGRLIDRFGAGPGIGVCLLVWSAAASLHSLVGGLVSLMLLRFLLGLAEPGLYPGAIKTLSGLFSPASKGLPIGIVVSGASVGAMLAPPLVLGLSNAYGWRAAFLITGLSGFLLYIAWQRLQSDISGAHAASGAMQSDRDALGGTLPSLRWIELLRLRPVRAYMAARALGDPAWYFVVFWLPDYLVRARGFSLGDLGQLGWLPYVGLDAGVILGGVAAAGLIRRSMASVSARLAIAVFAAGLFTVGIIGSSAVVQPLAILLLIAAAVFAIGLWMATIYALPADVLPLSSTASIVGLGGASGAIGGIGFVTATGLLVDRGLYGTAFSSAPVLFVASVVILVIGMGRWRDST